MKKALAAVLSLALCFALSTFVWAGSGSVTVTSNPSLNDVDVYGPLSGYADLGDEAWGTSVPAVAAWVHPSWPSITGAFWISSPANDEDYVNDSWRWFHHEFTIPCSAYNVDDVAYVEATSDNAEEFYFNGEFVGSDGGVQGPFVDNYEWNTKINYEVYPVPGTNTLDFIVRNYGMSGGTATGNPTGLIYKTTIDYQIPEVEWLPPVTHEPFTLKDGTTLPLKFQLFEQDGTTLITERKNVILELYKGGCVSMDVLVASWELGAGVENLRFDEYEYYYIANFKTKDFDDLAEDTYHAVVRDACDESLILVGCISFDISSDKGTNRGNNKEK